jgi:hypothetical protein
VSVAPATLLALQAFLKPLTELPAVSLGIVGNAKHKSGYHLGRDRIFGPHGQGEKDYSVKTSRDDDGLSKAASAMDIGAFKRLRQMSKFIVAEARANAPDTRDIREIIYSPDGKKVLRWDRERGVASKPKQEGDDSHLIHTHVSWYRDSADRDKTALFIRFFQGGAATATPKARPTPKPAKGEIVKSFSVPKEPSVCTVPKGVRLFVASDLKAIAFNVDPGRDMPYLGEPFTGVAIVHRTKEDGTPTGKAFFARKSDLKNIRPAPVGPMP